MTKEKEFFDALKDIFIGAKVDGESGFINLMWIKSRYYEKGVFPKLNEDIDKALENFPSFREELFDKLYSFFHRYFSETGSIYFRYTPIHQNVYEKVYTDDKDVILFWKTHMLYYVKTDRLFKNLDLEIDGVKFFFDVSKLEHKKANEKRELIYEFAEKKDDGTIVFNVNYSENGKKTRIDEIIRELRKDTEISEDILEKAFSIFEKQNEVDYFINKNAREFLREQFNIWLYQYVFSGESDWTADRIRQLQSLKEIAFKVIDFISQFEDELVRIWNKPKFVLNSNYVVTLDHIANRDMALIEKLINHTNMKQQMQEWQELGIVDEGFEVNEIIEADLTGKRLADKYQCLPIDTKYFRDLELEILRLFENLDQELDGWVIESENYQGLNTILKKFEEKIKVIYIDPPYNTEGDEFLYKDRFQRSSWLSMMADRLTLARNLMFSDGCVFISLDDNEQHELRCFMESLFGTENFVGLIAWEKRFTRNNNAKMISTIKDYLLVFRNSNHLELLRELRTEKADSTYSNPDNDTRGDWTSVSYVNPATKAQRPNLVYPLKNPITGHEVVHPTNAWKYKPEEYARHVIEKRLYWGAKGENKYPRLKRFLSEVGGLVPVDIWKHEDSGTTDEASIQLQHFFGEKVFDNPKPTRLIERIGDMLYNSQATKDSLFLDFFAGSGTTAHAIINLNKKDKGKRKYILIEMDEWFETVILRRLKKLVFSDNWKDGKPNGGQGISHFLKYFSLEQYEDTLKKVTYEDSDFFDNPYEDPYNQYVFMKDIKLLDALEIDYKNNKVDVDLSKLYKNIDIPETLSNLTGKWIKRITEEYVEFEDDEKINIKELDYKLIKPLIWW